MVSSVDGLAGAVAVGSSGASAASRCCVGGSNRGLGASSPRLYVTGWLATSLRLAYDVARKRRHLAPIAHSKVARRAGFELAITSLRGWGPGPLDERRVIGSGRWIRTASFSVNSRARSPSPTECLTGR